VVEQQLCAALPPERWTRTSDTLILHGRRICKPKPLCDLCSVRDDCEYYQVVIRGEGAAARVPRKAARGRPAAAARARRTIKK
jgi:adenine-specific DNA glycosylase